MARRRLRVSARVGACAAAVLCVVASSGCSPETPVGSVFAPTSFECPPDFAAAVQADAGDDAVAQVVESAEFGLAELAEELQDGCSVLLSAPGEPDTYFGVVPAKVGVAGVVTAARGAGFRADVVDDATGLGQYSKALLVDDATGEVSGEVLDISLVAAALVPGVAEHFASGDIVVIYIDLGDS